MSIYKRCSDCSHCALDGKRIVYGTMPEAAGNGIVLLGEAPGAAEEAEGVPFTGPSGRLLNWALKCSGIDRHKCWVTNSILCRAPLNDIGGFEGESAKKACSSGLAQELRAAKQAGCRVIVALGETALRSLGVSGSPSSLRGSVLDGTGAASGFFVIPTYHPAYLYRNNWTRVAGGSASHTAVWLSDLEKAREVARPGWKRPQERFITHPTILDLEALWQRVQREPDLVLGVDIETTSLDPRYGEIVVIGFSWSEEDAICVPLLKAGPVGPDGRRHGIPYWPNGSATKARYYLEKILTTAKQMYQNGFFDIPYLRFHGFPVPDSLYTYDSMLLHAIVSPETEHNLGFITSVYGKTPYWKDEFKNRAGGIFDMDETRMRAYNCRDCVTLQQIVPAMLRHMDDLGLRRVWDEEVHPMVRPIMIMKEKGVLFNKSRMASFQEKMTKRLQEKALELRTLGSLPEAFNISSDDEVRLFLFGVQPSKAVQLISWVFTGQEPCKPTKAEPDRTHRPGEKIVTGILDEKAARRELPDGFIVESARKVPTLEVKKKGTNLYEDLLTLDTILRETHPLYLVPGYNGPKTDGGKFATNKDGLLSLRIAAQNRLDYLDSLKTPREDEVTRCTDLLVWLEAFADYSAAEKLITAFTRYRTSSDGRIHPNWQIHGTACVVGDTLIPTAFGIFKASELISPTLEGFEEKHLLPLNRYNEHECTSHAFRTIRDTTYKVRFAGNFELQATPEHPILTPTGWKKIAELKVGEYVCSNYAMDVFAKVSQLTPDKAFLLGAYLSDGSIHQYEVRFSNHDIDVQSAIAAAATKEGYRIRQYSDYVSIAGVSAVEEFKGILQNGAYAKKVPQLLYQLDRKSAISFLRGMSLDSTVSACSSGKGREIRLIMRFSSADFERVRLAQLYLMGLGIFSTLGSRINTSMAVKSRVGGEVPKRVWCLTLNGNNAKEACAQLSIYAAHRKIAENFEITHPWGRKNTLLTESSLYLKVTNTKKIIGKTVVYDFTLPNTHSFVSGNVISHNTGRLSCTDPNLMQLPSGKVRKEDKEIRRFFYAPEGWSMVSSDFSSAEVGLLAFELDDEAMIKDYEAGISPHAANVKILFGFDKGHPLFEEAKLGAKKFQFGGLSYGGGDRFVFRQITKECTHIKLSFADYQKGKAAWMALHPKYEAWRTALEAEVLEKRIIYNEFGRARIFLDNDKDIVKEAMNFKIQSAGASILNRVIARIQARIDAHVPALKGYPIMQIHDQLVYECPDEEIEVFKTFITEEMTRPFMYKGHPRSLRIELSTGKTFGDLD